MGVNEIFNIDFDPVCYTQYDDSITENIDMGLFKPSSSHFRDQVLWAYEELGVAKIKISDIGNPRAALKEVAESFGFSTAFVPDQYPKNNGLHDDFGINQISHERDPTLVHEGFLSNEEQAVHVDGTLEQIGTVPTTMMLCQSQGISGGESRIFNSVAAFCQLAEEDLELANALLSEKALTRSDVDRSGSSTTGPAFATNEHGLVTRFALDNTSTWNVNEVDNLLPALKWMKNNLAVDSNYYTEFKLRPGDLLIVANHKISHGRNKYEDDNSHRRKLYRTLFNNPITLF